LFSIGADFAHSGVDGPSIFPHTAVGLRLAVKPSANSMRRAALLDGVPVVRRDGSRVAFRAGDGLLMVGEFAWLSRGGGAAGMSPPAMRDRIGRRASLAPYDDKLALGVWCYIGGHADLSDVDSAGDPLVRRGSYGAYVVGEPGCGPTNDGNQIGLSLAHARSGHHYLGNQSASGVRRAEATLELSYLTQLSKYVTLQADLQCVMHPNTEPALANALLLQLRFEVAF